MFFPNFIDQPEMTRTYVFVGDKKSGKSNLILKFLDIQMSNSEPVKETVALDFKYGVKKMDDKKVRI